jgi:hypothetical protein
VSSEVDGTGGSVCPALLRPPAVALLGSATSRLGMLGLNIAAWRSLGSHDPGDLSSPPCRVHSPRRRRSHLASTGGCLAARTARISPGSRRTAVRRYADTGQGLPLRQEPTQSGSRALGAGEVFVSTNARLYAPPDPSSAPSRFCARRLRMLSHRPAQPALPVVARLRASQLESRPIARPHFRPISSAPACRDALDLQIFLLYSSMSIREIRRPNGWYDLSWSRPEAIEALPGFLH